MYNVMYSVYERIRNDNNFFLYLWIIYFFLNITNSSPDHSFQELDLDKKHSPILHVLPISEPMQGTNKAPKLDVITQEEDDVWDQNKNEPLPGTLGFVGVELGPNGEVPKGFRKDEEGNVIVSVCAFHPILYLNDWHCCFGFVSFNFMFCISLHFFLIMELENNELLEMSISSKFCRMIL